MSSEKNGGSEQDSWVDVAHSERSYVTAGSTGVPWPGTGDGWNVPASQKGKGGKQPGWQGDRARQAGFCPGRDRERQAGFCRGRDRERQAGFFCPGRDRERQ